MSHTVIRRAGGLEVVYVSLYENEEVIRRAGGLEVSSYGALGVE